MADEKSKPEKADNVVMYALAAVVVIAAALALANYGGFFSQPAAQPVVNSTATLPLATPEARLLLASFDRGAALGDYALNYSANDNGVKSRYSLVKNGTDSWVWVEGVFGKMGGFFGADNATDIVCLEYEGVLRCAQAGNGTDMADIAASLKILRPNSIAYANQKDDMRRLISAGAIMLQNGMVEEKVGGFDTQKITYTLDYSNLTVQQMVSLGISPSDESLLTVTDQVVTFWIDKETGMMAKSHATYRKLGVDGYYDTEYSQLSMEAGAMPGRPSTVVAPEAFVAFYSQSVEDYSERAACMEYSGTLRDECFKSIAVGKGSWDTCKLIENGAAYEGCTLMVAQVTRNKVLCESLPTLADECYIAVAGETGNFELCQLLKNGEMLASCTEAAAFGKRVIEEQEAEDGRLHAAHNCVEDVDCGTFGNAGQYCAPKNSTGLFANETSPLFACLDGVPCGCQQGFCGFAKNDTYYACISKVEEALIEEYMKGLIPNGNSTKTPGEG